MYLHIQMMEKHGITDKIDGTIDNKAGYGSPEAAEKLFQWFTHLKDLGNKVILESPWSDTIPTMAIRYQEFRSNEYEPGYCAPEVEAIGRNSYNDIQKGAAFLKKIARRMIRLEEKRLGKGQSWERDAGNWVLEDPSRLIETLEYMGAKYISIYKGASSDGFTYQSAWIFSSEPRPWLLTDTLTAQFRL